MALPSLVKTWEHKTNWFVYGDLTSDTLGQNAACDIKDLLCDFVPRCGAWNEGTFTFSSPTVTYTAPSSRFDSVFFGNLVGKTVRIRGATTPGNDGDFTITVQTATTLQWSNASGAAEALTGSLNVFAGGFTVPWELSHTGTSTVHGVADDEIDRLAGDPTRLGGGTGNIGYWVIKNPLTASWWSYSSDSNTTGAGYKANQGVLRATLAPDVLEVPSGLDQPPQGSVLEDGTTRSHVEYNSFSQYWLYNFASGGPHFKVHVAMSNDGEQTRLVVCSQGYAMLAWIDGIVRNPHPLWDVGGGVSTPAVTCMRAQGSLDNEWTYGDFNDNARIQASEIPLPAGSFSKEGGVVQHKADFYLTSEGAGSQANGQNLASVNQLAGEYGLFPCGLQTLSSLVAGRLGELPDIWWCPTDLILGDTLPDDTSRQFLCLTDLVIPWNGDIPEVE